MLTIRIIGGVEGESFIDTIVGTPARGSILKVIGRPIGLPPLSPKSSRSVRVLSRRSIERISSSTARNPGSFLQDSARPINLFLRSSRTGKHASLSLLPLTNFSQQLLRASTVLRSAAWFSTSAPPARTDPTTPNEKIIRITQASTRAGPDPRYRILTSQRGRNLIRAPVSCLA